MKAEEKAWAQRTFGDVRLGNVSRVRRLVSIATTLARRPAGTVTAVFAKSAEREGAFRWLGNGHVSAQALADAVSRSTLRACGDRVFCAVDGTSMTVTDEEHGRDVGAVGSWSKGARGLQALTALALDERGTPIGLAGVEFWARTRPSQRVCKQPDFRLEGELRHTIELVRRIDDQRRVHAANVRIWYQFDRGFDSSALFRLIEERGLTATIRASTDRRLDGRGKPRYLRATARRAPVLGEVFLDLPARAGRPARLAVVQVRATRVRLSLPISRTSRVPVEMTAVLAKEIGYSGEGRLEWLLLTTEPVSALSDAKTVLDGYAMRWRIEDLHRAWKSGWCNVEKTQLRARAALMKWATLHLAVAARATRLTHLARTEPTKPSSTEFSREEIDAVLLLQKGRAKHKVGEDPPLGDLVTLVAELGGYTGKSSGGPPGATVIGRGLNYIASLAVGLRLQRET